MTVVDARLRLFTGFCAGLLFILSAVLAFFFMVPAPAGAREFTPKISVDVDPATADTAPALTQTLTRHAQDPWLDLLHPSLLHGEQIIKDMSLILPTRWRVNGESLIEPCKLPAGATEETPIDPNLCPGGGSGEVGTVLAHMDLSFLFGLQMDAHGKVYYVRSDDYYQNPNLGNRPDWVSKWKDASANGGALPVILGIQLDPLLGIIDIPPIYLNSYLRPGDYRIQADINDIYANDPLWKGMMAYLQKMDLSFNGGDHNALFRTPVTSADACTGDQVFTFNATSYPDPEYPGHPDSDPEQKVTDKPAPVAPLGGCGQVSAPFAPRIKVESTTTDAGKNPDLKISVFRDAGDAYLTGMKMTLPEGMVGSPYATPTRCSDAQAEANQCPPDSKVAEAKMQVDVFESREVEMKANVYNSDPVGSELARFLTVVEGPPIAKDQIVVLPVLLNALPGVKGLEAVVNGMPPEFDVRKVEFNFMGSTGANTGHPLLINPTSCGTGSIGVDFGSEMGQSHSVSAPYTATNCDALPYDPNLSVNLSCTDPHCLPEITATLNQGAGEATTEEQRLSIPSGFVLNTASKVKPCSNDQIAAGGCPPESQMGSVVAESPLAIEPLTGKVFLAEVAPGDTTSVRRIHAELTGLIDISIDGTLVNNDQGGFDTVISGLPQVPITRLELKLDGGEDKALVYTPFACGPHSFTSTFKSHSGRVVTKTSSATLSGTGCAPTMNVRLKPDKARARPTMDVIVRPNQGTPPLKTMKIKLGSGKKKLKVRGVRFTQRERRAARRAGESARKRSSSRRRRPSLAIGSLKLTPQSGKSTTSKLVSKGGRRVKTKTRKRGALSLSKTTVTLRRRQLLVRGLPSQNFRELRIRIVGKKKRVLTNPRRGGTITFKGIFTDIEGGKYKSSAKEKVRSAKKKRSKRRRSSKRRSR